MKEPLTGTTAERITGVVGYLLYHSNWFITVTEGMIEGHSGRGRLRQKYMDEGKEVCGYQETVYRREEIANQPLG